MVDKDDSKTLEGALQIEYGSDQVTLFTCTPYGVNSHRLLVRGHREPYIGVDEEGTPASLIGTSLRTSYLLWVLVGLGVTGAFILFLYSREVKEKRKRNLPVSKLTEPEDTPTETHTEDGE